jgi:plastin-1
LLSRISFENHPELEALLAEDEEVSVLSYLNAEANLIRWVNYHLKRSGSTSVKLIKNFGEDIKVNTISILRLLYA